MFDFGTGSGEARMLWGRHRRVDEVTCCMQAQLHAAAPT